jgi:hypothetical protein
MGERRARRRDRRRPPYHDYLMSDPRRRGPLRRLWDRLTGRRLVPAPLGGGGAGWDDEDGGAGVREPRRPLPRTPQGAADLPRD